MKVTRENSYHCHKCRQQQCEPELLVSGGGGSVAAISVADEQTALPALLVEDEVGSQATVRHSPDLHLEVRLTVVYYTVSDDQRHGRVG